jgi:PKHD-type hydroxylase
MISIIELLDAAAVTRLRELVAAATFVDGKMTAGGRARRVKNNELMDPDAAGTQEARKLIGDALSGNTLFARIAFPQRVRAAMINRYTPDMAYGPHIDNALMGNQPRMRADIALTVFISDVNEYEGGELAIEGEFGRHKIKRPAGQMVIYPASSLHQVLPVTKGARVVAVSWVQSFIRDPARRQILFDLERVRRKLAELANDSPEADLAHKTYSNLMRMWSEV